MFLEKPYIVGARALSDCLVLHVAREAVFAELDRNPTLARRMIANLSAKMHSTVQEVELNALGTGSQRFAAWLLKSLPAANAGAAAVTLPAAKKTVASRLNLSAEHLSRILGQLSAAGLIRVHGRKVEIPDAERLRDWSERRHS
jgi:CRP-like cAMP-binding protein